MIAAGVVIVGASAAGLTVAQCLRQRDYRGPVTLLGAEAHLPYDRPSLSKQVLAGTSAPRQRCCAARPNSANSTSISC
jgi:NADPH-dependent 2,4-dienoyl-CoA reductase/sulfur reductase-like enzyme